MVSLDLKSFLDQRPHVLQVVFFYTVFAGRAEKTTVTC